MGFNSGFKGLIQLTIRFPFRYRYQIDYERVRNDRLFDRLLQYANNQRLFSKFTLVATVIVQDCVSLINRIFC